jgi:hypothetical protein
LLALAETLIAKEATHHFLLLHQQVAVEADITLQQLVEMAVLAVAQELALVEHT